MILPLLLALACSPNTGDVATSPSSTTAAPASGGPTSVAGLEVQRHPNGLNSWVIKPGTGAAPAPGQTVKVDYTGWLKHNGERFDSSVGKRPFTFRLGAGEVIPGWDQGVALLKVGEKRQFEIPADLAYGADGAGGVIPPGAALIFDVELLGIQ